MPRQTTTLESTRGWTARPAIPALSPNLSAAAATPRISGPKVQPEVSIMRLPQRAKLAPTAIAACRRTSAARPATPPAAGWWMPAPTTMILRRRPTRTAPPAIRHSTPLPTAPAAIRVIQRRPTMSKYARATRDSANAIPVTPVWSNQVTASPAIPPQVGARQIPLNRRTMSSPAPTISPATPAIHPSEAVLPAATAMPGNGRTPPIHTMTQGGLTPIVSTAALTATPATTAQASSCSPTPIVKPATPRWSVQIQSSHSTMTHSRRSAETAPPATPALTAPPMQPSTAQAVMPTRHATAVRRCTTNPPTTWSGTVPAVTVQ